jgi:hypothetical protein
MAGTIGDPRRITRRICSESVTTRPRDPWKAEADWSPPGPAASFDPVNRQAASSNLGVVYNQNPWALVASSYDLTYLRIRQRLLLNQGMVVQTTTIGVVFSTGLCPATGT